MRTRCFLIFLLIFSGSGSLSMLAQGNSGRQSRNKSETGNSEKHEWKRLRVAYSSSSMILGCSGARELLDRYQLECPILLSKESGWYKKPLIVRFLNEFINNNVRTKQTTWEEWGQPIVRWSVKEVSLLDDGSVNIVSLHNIADEIRSSISRGQRDKAKEEQLAEIVRLQQLIRQLFADKAVFDAVIFGELLFLRKDELKDELQNDRLIDFNRLWGAALNAIETVPGLRLQPASETSQGDTKSIKTFPRRMFTVEPGFVVFEEVTMSMNSSDKYSVLLTVLSEVCRRRLSARNCVPIRVENQAKVSGRLSFIGADSEIPAMEAVVNAVMR